MFCLFMFRSITLKQQNSLITIETFSCHGYREVTQQTSVPAVPGSIPGSDKDSYVCLYHLLLKVFFTCLVQKYYFMKCCHSYCIANSYSMHNILQSLCPIISLSIYRPSIFKQMSQWMRVFTEKCLAIVLFLLPRWVQIQLVVYFVENFQCFEYYIKILGFTAYLLFNNVICKCIWSQDIGGQYICK